MTTEMTVQAIANIGSKPAVVKLVATSQALLVQAARVPVEIGIDDDDVNERVVELSKRLGATYRGLEDQRVASVKPINGVVKAVNAYFKDDCNMLELKVAREGLGTKLTARAGHVAERQRREAAAEARRLQDLALQESIRIEEAKRKAEAEAAEAQRLAWEAGREAREAAERAKSAAERVQAREAEERARMDAEKAQRAAEDARAMSSQAVLDTAEQITGDTKAPITRTEFGSSASTRKTWVFELNDISKVPAEFLALNEVLVRKAIREGARDISGLRIFEQSKVVVR